MGEKPGEVFIGRDLANMGNVAAETLELVDSETHRMVRDAEETARAVIELNAALLEEMANTLLDTETLSGLSLEVFLEAVVPWQTSLVEQHKNGSSPIKMRAAAGVAANGDDAVGGLPTPDA